MNTKTANAKNTNPIRLRMSGTVSAFRRVFSTRLLLLRRFGGGFAEIGADRSKRFARRCREEDVAELQAGRQRGVALLELRLGRAAEHLDAVPQVAQLAARLERLRADLDRGGPAGEIADVEHRELGAEVADIARFLRDALALPKTTYPRRLAAFERGTLAAAGADGLALAAFAARFDHARTVSAADARALRTGVRVRLEGRERERRR